MGTTSDSWTCAGLSTSGTTTTTASLGTANTGVTAVEEGHGHLHKTTLTFSLATPDVADNAAKAVGVLLYTLPAGACVIRSAYMSLAHTVAEDTTATPDVGLGTVIATGAVATLDGTAAFENVITGQTAADSNGTATVKTAVPDLVIEAADAHTLYANVADTWADTAGSDLSSSVSGTVVIFWEKLT